MVVGFGCVRAMIGKRKEWACVGFSPMLLVGFMIRLYSVFKSDAKRKAKCIANSGDFVWSGNYE